jgi:hypothetical protein
VTPNVSSSTHPISSSKSAPSTHTTPETSLTKRLPGSLQSTQGSRTTNQNDLKSSTKAPDSATKTAEAYAVYQPCISFSDDDLEVPDNGDLSVTELFEIDAGVVVKTQIDADLVTMLLEH